MADLDERTAATRRSPCVDPPTPLGQNIVSTVTSPDVSGPAKYAIDEVIVELTGGFVMADL
jgi:hypothetical protein